MADDADNAYIPEVRAPTLTQKQADYPAHPIGACHFCETPLPPNTFFCNDDCEADWKDQLNRQRRRIR